MSSSETESDSNSEPESASFSNEQLPSFETLKEILHQGQYNWFSVVDFIEQVACEDISDYVLETHLKDFYSFALELPFQSQQKEQLITSHAAF